MSSSQVGPTIDRGLKIQADLSKPWDAYWAPLFGEARAAKIMSDEQWARYARQTIEQCTKVRTRPLLRQSTDDPLIIEFGNARIGRQAGFYPIMRMVAMHVDGAETKTDSAINMSAPQYLANFNLLHRGSIPEFADQLQKLPLGHHKGFFRVNLRVPKGGFMPRGVKIDPANVLAESNLQFPFEFDLVDASSPIIKSVKDPAIKDQLALTLRVEHLILMGWNFALEMSCSGALPANLSHKVYIRDGGVEYFVGDVVSPMVVRGRTRLELTNEPNSRLQDDIELTGNKVDVVLRPDPEIAVQRPDIETFLDEEIVLKDVHIDDPMAAGRKMKKEIEAQFKAESLRPQSR